MSPLGSVIREDLFSNSIDSNGVVNLHQKINKTGPHLMVKENTFFYSRLAAYKGSFIY